MGHRRILQQRAYRSDPEVKKKRAAKQREYYQRTLEIQRKKEKERREENREQINKRRRDRYKARGPKISFDEKKRREYIDRQMKSYHRLTMRRVCKRFYSAYNKLKFDEAMHLLREGK